MDNVKKAKDLIKPILMYESLHEKMKRVKRKSESLQAREEDTREELNYAESLRLKRPKREVERWLEHVGQIKDEVRKAEQEVQDTKFNWLPNFQLPAKLDRLITEVEDLCRQGEFSQGLTLETNDKRFEASMILIMESLRDDNVLRIGVYGMGGVGKTTLLTHVNNELLRSWPGFSVVWVTVSQNFGVHKLQDDIARALNFNFSCNDDETIRSAELWNFWERKKNLVLILDDVWEVIHLEKVGVGVSSANGCKLILTTRFIDLCSKMDCDNKIAVKPLCDEESWELFKDELGDDFMLTPEIDEVAKSLVKECAGLPLGIIVMARSMKGVDDLFVWRNALEYMKESKPGHGDMENEVFQVLEHSYEMLKDPIVQQCFLDCSLYRKGSEIRREELINLFIDDGLIDGMKSRQAEFDRGHTILNKLVNVCLLENCEIFTEKGVKNGVKMHDLVRDMALRITSNRPRFLVEAGKGLRSIPDQELWKEDLVKVSLMDNHIDEIPSTFDPPECPKLSTLILRGSGLSRISDEFFLHMKGLVLLDLSNTLIEILPNSITELVNLSVLSLNKCWELKYIPSLEKLRELKKLDLYGSKLNKVPHGLGDLIKLRHLNLLSKTINNLEYMIEVTDKDIMQLRKLENLSCSFDGLDSFNAYVASLVEKGPTFYQLYYHGRGVIPRRFEYETFGDHSRAVCWEFFHVHKGNTLLLPKCVEAISITSGIVETDGLCDVVSLTNVINLRSLEIYYLHGIEYLFSHSNSSVLQTIETLDVRQVFNLKGLISGGQGIMFPNVTFSSLRTLRLEGSHYIERLFTNAQGLPNLEMLMVFWCESLVEIISNTGKRADDGPVIITLPKLKNLTLYGLPSLRSVAVISDVVERVEIRSCPNLRRIPILGREQCPTSLEEVYIDEESMESLDMPFNHGLKKMNGKKMTLNGTLNWKKMSEIEIEAGQIQHRGFSTSG